MSAASKEAHGVTQLIFAAGNVARQWGVRVYAQEGGQRGRGGKGG